ncbi:unnamed protein product [Prunus armeniaca]
MSNTSFKELTFIITKEYTSYRMIKKTLDHLFNLCKKHDESLRDYIKKNPDHLFSYGESRVAETVCCGQSCVGERRERVAAREGFRIQKELP